MMRGLVGCDSFASQGAEHRSSQVSAGFLPHEISGMVTCDDDPAIETISVTVKSTVVGHARSESPCLSLGLEGIPLKVTLPRVNHKCESS